MLSVEAFNEALERERLLIATAAEKYVSDNARAFALFRGKAALSLANSRDRSHLTFRYHVWLVFRRPRASSALVRSADVAIVDTAPTSARQQFEHLLAATRGLRWRKDEPLSSKPNQTVPDPQTNSASEPPPATGLLAQARSRDVVFSCSRCGQSITIPTGGTQQQCIPQPTADDHFSKTALRATHKPLPSPPGTPDVVQESSVRLYSDQSPFQHSKLRVDPAFNPSAWSTEASKLLAHAPHSQASPAPVSSLPLPCTFSPEPPAASPEKETRITVLRSPFLSLPASHKSPQTTAWPSPLHQSGCAALRTAESKNSQSSTAQPAHSEPTTPPQVNAFFNQAKSSSRVALLAQPGKGRRESLGLQSAITQPAVPAYVPSRWSPVSNVTEEKGTSSYSTRQEPTQVHSEKFQLSTFRVSSTRVTAPNSAATHHQFQHPPNRNHSLRSGVSMPTLCSVAALSDGDAQISGREVRRVYKGSKPSSVHAVRAPSPVSTSASEIGGPDAYDQTPSWSNQSNGTDADLSFPDFEDVGADELVVACWPSTGRE
ncbi:hypothetical protein DIPPA_59262 [Diplonema papillatum]|nr:hypothetical protein DIPPA_59262 [Diplonema papillatum]